jgi:hypothetical protein
VVPAPGAAPDSVKPAGAIEICLKHIKQCEVGGWGGA